MRSIPSPLVRALVAIAALAGAILSGGAAGSSSPSPAPPPVAATVAEAAAPPADTATPRVLRALARERRDGRSRLARSRTGREQAEHAAALSDAYQRAARRLPSTAPAGTGAALRRVADVYGDLATAARGGSEQGYADAAERVAARERALRARLAG